MKQPVKNIRTAALAVAGFAAVAVPTIKVIKCRQRNPRIGDSTVVVTNMPIDMGVSSASGNDGQRCFSLGVRPVFGTEAA